MVANNVEYQGVPTGADLEGNSNQKKYTVNKTAPSGHILISKTACTLMAVGVFLLLLLAVVATYFLVPLVNATDKPVESEDTVKEASIFPPLLSNPITKKNDPPEVIHQRLPRTVLPTEYRIKIMPFLSEGNFTTSGEVIMKLDVTDDTKKIIFYAKDLDIHKDSIMLTRTGDGKKMPIFEQNYDETSEKYVIVTEDILSEGEKYELIVKYTGYLKNNMQGFYRSSYLHSGTNQTRWLASTQFSPTSARRAFPCMDEPSFKSKFKISLARPDNMTTLSNTPIEDTKPVKTRANWVWDHYVETPPMSTYLVAFIVSDLQQYITLNQNPKLSLWSRQDVIFQTSYASNIAPKLLKYFEEKFKIKFPLSKVDIVAVPDFGFNAMENWGLITFRESALLFDQKQSTVDDKRNIALVMGHEIAHQWFGNLVTPSWWEDLWLKEGFATYYQYLGVNEVEKSWSIMSEFTLMTTENALQTDCLPSSRPLYFPVKNNDQIIQAFDPISYEKGASIIRMASNALGEETFTKGINKYLETHKYKNADHNDVWNALDKQLLEEGLSLGNLSVGTIMNTWVTQPGYPVLSASFDSGNNVLTVKQRRYFLNPDEKSDATWYIPISCTTSMKPNFTDTKPKWWLESVQEASFPLSTNRWYLLNLQKTGYYIVNYDEKNWKMLLEDFNTFPPHVRSQLVGDSMDLARSGIIDYDIPLRMVTEVGLKDKQIDFIPLKVSLDKLQYIRRMLSNTPIYGDFEKFVKTIFTHAFELVTLDEKPNETYRQQKIRRAILKWTLSFDESDAMHNAREVFRDWVISNKPIRPNLRTEVCCGAVRLGVDSEWNFLHNEYLKTNIPAEKDSYLQAMGCSSKPWILSKYLNMMLSNDSTVRKQDGAKLFDAVANNPVGYQVAFDFLRSNWKEIKAHYGDGFNMISKLIDSLSSYMNTEFQLQQLITFREEHKAELGAAKQAFDKTIHKVAFNVKWMKMNYRSIEDWLHEQEIYFRW